MTATAMRASSVAPTGNLQHSRRTRRKPLWLRIDQYALHDEDGGAGEFRGGKGVVLDYRITSDEAFLTYSATRTRSRPWGLAGGQPGSCNRAEVLRADGSVEVYSMVTAIRAQRGEPFAW
jgi:N-methylhydantoinase B